MFSYENYKAFYDGVAFFITPINFICLLIAWKSINTRMLLISLITLEAIDTLLTDWSFTLGNNYHIYGVFICSIFLFTVLFRRLLAKLLGKHVKFCNDVYNNFSFSKQEAAITFMYFIVVILHVVALIEVKLYQYDIIDSFPFRNNVFPPSITILHLLEALMLLKLSIRHIPIDEYVQHIKSKFTNNRKVEGTNSYRESAEDRNDRS
ncbi:hypothetical protein [Pseudoalteromonas obscura]|uniref:Uncharacterized protein n=1 Tax=Pseudoalteromonas obscura TaxID=3048491 RepID=A0ABT7EK97_9GAMM|nr:hypothetical protein [Pseudoalteromonas sp. P94(2023)]MDK2595443.1 hypothetical protein [Pseudoalteromonas sp. P94(2023)]